MSPVPNLGTFIPRTKPSESKHRKILPFGGSPLARWHTGAVDGSSTQSRSYLGDTLTARERDVLAMISHGLSNKSIARILAISPETVKTHVKHVFVKLAVNTRSEAVCRAGSLGLLELDFGIPLGRTAQSPV